MCRYRDSSGNPTASPLKGCVLFDQNQLTKLQKSCFISCNSVLTCAYGGHKKRAAVSEHLQQLLRSADDDQHAMGSAKIAGGI